MFPAGPQGAAQTGAAGVREDHPDFVRDAGTGMAQGFVQGTRAGTDVVELREQEGRQGCRRGPVSAHPVRALGRAPGFRPWVRGHFNEHLGCPPQVIVRHDGAPRAWAATAAAATAAMGSAG